MKMKTLDPMTISYSGQPALRRMIHQRRSAGVS